MLSSVNTCIVAILSCISLNATALAQDSPNDKLKQNPPGFLTNNQLQEQRFNPLFTGTDLSSWRVEQGHVGHWIIREGSINYDGKATQKKHLDRSLWTKKSFGEAILYVEWRFPDKPIIKQHPIVLWNGDFLRDEAGKRITRPHLDAGDSGILFRGILDFQANIWCQELGSGEINGYRVNKSLPQTLRRSCIPFEFGDNPLGQWNAFLITIQKSRMKVELNGKQVLFSEPLPNLPANGPIGLQHHGDHVQFRNIWVKELSSDE
ncbi:MAG: DUF1080 domain-containing protein [Planctomycetaceae bacterium]|nr:DUF1080 domain-containing protein [Planctomycetaceae bacterium]